MTPTASTENLRQYKNKFSLIEEQTLAFALNTWLQKLSPKFKRSAQ